MTSWDEFEAALVDHAIKFGHIAELDEQGNCRRCVAMKVTLDDHMRQMNDYLASLPTIASYVYEEEPS